MGAAPRPTTARRPLPYAEKARTAAVPAVAADDLQQLDRRACGSCRIQEMEKSRTARFGAVWLPLRTEAVLSAGRRAHGPTARSSLSWAVTRFRPRRALAPQAEQQSSVRLLPSACVPGSTAATALAEATQRVVLAPGHGSRDSEAVGLRGWPLLRRKRPPDRRRLRLLEGVRGRALHRDRPCS